METKKENNPHTPSFPMENKRYDFYGWDFEDIIRLNELQNEIDTIFDNAERLKEIFLIKEVYING